MNTEIKLPASKIVAGGERYHGFRLADGTHVLDSGEPLNLPPLYNSPYTQPYIRNGGWNEVRFSAIPGKETFPNNAIITGWAPNQREINPNRGPFADRLTLAQNAWVWRDSLGTPWCLWFDSTNDSSWPIKAHRITRMSVLPDPAATAYTVGYVTSWDNRADLQEDGSGYFYSYCAGWVNQSRTGRRAAIHRYGNTPSSAATNKRCDILKVDVLDSNNGDPPTVVQDGAAIPTQLGVTWTDPAGEPEIHTINRTTWLVTYDEDTEDPQQFVMAFEYSQDLDGGPPAIGVPATIYTEQKLWWEINTVEVQGFRWETTRLETWNGTVWLPEVRTGQMPGIAWYVMHGKFIIGVRGGTGLGGMSEESNPQWVEEFWSVTYPIMAWITHKASAVSSQSHLGIGLFDAFFEDICIDKNGVLDTNKIRRF
jgi:hypothetical protein